MTRQQAQERAEQLNPSEAGGDRHWTARETPEGDWEVVAVRFPGLKISAGAQGTLTYQRPEPVTPPDPRPSSMRQIPPYGPGL